MVGGEDDELRDGPVERGRPEALAAERRPRPVVQERPVEALHEVGDGAELRVVALSLAGQQRPQGVVEVVGPGGVVAQAAVLGRARHDRVVHPRLGDDV